MPRGTGVCPIAHPIQPVLADFTLHIHHTRWNLEMMSLFRSSVHMLPRSSREAGLISPASSKDLSLHAALMFFLS